MRIVQVNFDMECDAIQVIHFSYNYRFSFENQPKPILNDSFYMLREFE